MMTELERIRSDVAAGKPLAAQDAWFLIEEISRYRDLLRHARYQTAQVSISAKTDDGEVVVVANAVASEEATERALIREIRRTYLRLLRQSQKASEP